MLRFEAACSVETDISWMSSSRLLNRRSEERLDRLTKAAVDLVVSCSAKSTTQMQIRKHTSSHLLVFLIPRPTSPAPLLPLRCSLFYPFPYSFPPHAYKTSIRKSRPNRIATWGIFDLKNSSTKSSFKKNRSIFVCCCLAVECERAG